MRIGGEEGGRGREGGRESNAPSNTDQHDQGSVTARAKDRITRGDKQEALHNDKNDNCNIVPAESFVGGHDGG